MNWFTGIVVFLIVWWMTLFTVLPLWVKPVDKSDDAAVSGGAPDDPQLKKKFLLTTGLSVIIWCVIFACIHTKLIDFHELSVQMFKEDYK